MSLSEFFSDTAYIHTSFNMAYERFTGKKTGEYPIYENDTVKFTVNGIEIEATVAWSQKRLTFVLVPTENCSPSAGRSYKGSYYALTGKKVKFVRTIAPEMNLTGWKPDVKIE